MDAICDPGASRRAHGDTGEARSGSRARPSDHPDLAAAAAAAKEAIATIGFESRHGRAGRHRDCVEHLAASRIDTPHLALIALPGAVPEFAVDPGDAGDEAVGLDGAKDRAGLGIDLMDLARPIMPDPKCAFGPGEAWSRCIC